jgi:limonene-1,2-epoxide hydrolase
VGTWSAEASWRLAEAGERVRGAPRRRGRALGAIAALALLVLLGLIGLAVYAGQQAGQPVSAASLFCQALQARDYAGAYRLLSTSAQVRASESQFVAEERLHDAVDGPVVACRPVDGSGSSGIAARLSFLLGGRSSDAVSVTLARARIGTRTGAMELVAEGGTWRVDALAATLQGTPVEPLQVLAHFCASLVAASYQAAYDDLSANQQRLEQSESTFAQQVSPPAGSRYTGCAPEYASYRVDGGTATVRFTMSIAVAAPGGAQTVPVQATARLVEERGTWKLNGLDLPAM